MVKCVIFDFDGTIADTKHIAYEVYKILAVDLDMSIMSNTDFQRLKYITMRERFKKFNIKLYKIPRLVKKSMPIFKEHIAKADVFVGIKEALETLKANKIVCAIVSSNSEDNIHTFLIHHDMNDFDFVVGKASVFNKAKTLKQLIRKHKWVKEDVVYVGDEIRDIEACKKINLPMVAVSWGYDDVSLLEKNNPDMLVHTSKELLQYLIK